MILEQHIWVDRKLIITLLKNYHQNVLHMRTQNKKSKSSISKRILKSIEKVLSDIDFKYL